MASGQPNGGTIDTEQKKDGSLSKFLFLGVLPFIYTIGLAMILLNFSGTTFHTQVKWMANHIKVLFPQNTAHAKTKGIPQKEVASSNKAGQASSISQTKTQVKTLQTNKTEKVSDTPIKLKVETISPSKTNSTSTSTVSLQSMDPSSAAKLLSNMSEVDALKNLKPLTPDTQSAIIAAMPADIGARLTAALSSGKDPSTSTYSSSQLYQYMKPAQIATILNEIKDNQEVLRQIKQLAPDTASQVLAQMNPQVASWVVTHLN